MFDSVHFNANAALCGRLGSDIALSFSQPPLAGGVVMAAADHARLLRNLLEGRLCMGAFLGTQAVSTNPLTGNRAVSSARDRPRVRAD